MSVHFQARISKRDNPDAYEILKELRERGLSDREILDAALKAMDGWDLDDMAQVRTAAGALRRTITKVLENLEVATLPDIEKIIDRALANRQISSEKAAPRKSGRSRELSSMISSLKPADDDDWPEEEGE